MASTARSRGTAPSAWSWICVTAWRAPATTPDEERGGEGRRRDGQGDQDRLAARCQQGRVHGHARPPQGRYPAARPRVTIPKPSTATSRRSLNGTATDVGESWVSPSDRSTLATARSTTRKGRKTRKPMVKARRSSETTKAGARTPKPSSPAPTPGGGAPPARAARRAKARRSAGAANRARKARSGSAARRCGGQGLLRPSRGRLLLPAGPARRGDRLHDQQGDEQREAGHGRVGRDLGHAERRAQDREDHHHLEEGGEGDERERREGHRAEDERAARAAALRGAPAPARGRSRGALPFRGGRRAGLRRVPSRRARRRPGRGRAPVPPPGRGGSGP